MLLMIYVRKDACFLQEKHFVQPNTYYREKTISISTFDEPWSPFYQASFPEQRITTTRTNFILAKIKTWATKE